MQPDCLIIRTAVALLALATCPQARALEQSNCPEPLPGVAQIAHQPGMYNFYFENDLFHDTDRNYTNGVKFSWVSANLTDYINDPCLPHWARRFNQLFDIGHTGGHTSHNMVITIGQAIFTPRDKDATELIRDDRPYAGWLYLGLGYNARDTRQMDALEINLGVVGPAAQAQQSQDFIHTLRGIPRFHGWHNQLSNELGIQIVGERKNRVWQSDGPGGVKFDAITHYGFSLGNIKTHLNGGLELRAGSRIPNDFGTSPIRPAGDSNAPLEGAGTQRFTQGSMHAFISADARLVARDIFLDGNTFADSHSVPKKHLVGDLAAGLAWHWRGGKLTYAHYVRSKEFKSQGATHGYGSITLSFEY